MALWRSASTTFSTNSHRATGIVSTVISDSVLGGIGVRDRPDYLRLLYGRACIQKCSELLCNWMTFPRTEENGFRTPVQMIANDIVSWLPLAIRIHKNDLSPPEHGLHRIVSYFQVLSRRQRVSRECPSCRASFQTGEAQSQREKRHTESERQLRLNPSTVVGISLVPQDHKAYRRCALRARNS